MSDTALSVEANGINQIAENERKGRPRDLFWPWFAANVSVLGVAYGSYILGFAISFWQATIVGVLGVVLSFLFVGIISIAGKRGSAPTMTLTRAAFGVRGSRLPSLISWLLTVGWETSLVVVAVLATATIFDRLGAGGGTATKIVALIVIVGLVALGGTLGFNLIMRAQKWITWIAGVLTILYLVFAADHVDFGAVNDLPGGSAAAVIGALVFTMTGFGLGWVNAAADYSRYLPRSVSTRGVVGWTTLGSSLPPVVLVLFGILLAGSSPDLNAAIIKDPVGALTTILPTWFLVPFAVVTILGLVSGAIMDVYSSGLALLNVGLKAPRWVAVCIDSTLMLIGAIYVVFFASDFLGPFQGFLITLGVPIAAWCGIFIADIVLRKADYAEDELFDPRGRYGDVRWLSVGLVVVGSIIGWGLVTNTAASWLDWQGYLLGPIGGKDGDWAFANLGVLVALVLGFVGYLLLGRGAVRAQEARPAMAGSRT
ncbi:purine-cytosine permease family protein [Cryptosporangium sp. NPDC048952]|uniref:purine-cytosine permease family protein n=1 Tax=Cryptosporangium sp. NPDC048952 TaxID=3363961 RepID=UPI00371957A4